MPEKGIHKINLRVYGLIFNEQGDILLADEIRFGMRMTKFPGGGLQPGEGLKDCLRREALEELGQEIEILEHFYTTDFFQKAWFFEDQQLISVYYKAKLKAEPAFRIASKPFDFEEEAEGVICLRYVNLSKLQESDLSFPVDKHVLKLLREKY